MTASLAAAPGGAPPRPPRKPPPEARDDDDDDEGPAAQLVDSLAAPPPASLLAAFCASTLYTVSTYPFHRVKVLIQTQDANPDVLSGRTRRFKFLSAFGRLLREHGGRPSGLWHGCSPYLARHIPSVSVSFAAKDAFRAALMPLAVGGERRRGMIGGGDGDGRPAPVAPPPPPAARLLAANAAAGGLAGALALALVYPFELLTIRMSADVGGGGAAPAAAAAATATAASAARSRPPPATAARAWQYGGSPLDAARAVVAADGLRGLYRGFGPSVTSAAAYKALYFGLHDSAKEFAFGGRYATAAASASARRKEDDGGGASSLPLWRAALERLCIASGTTATAAALTHPLDVVRKRLVVDSGGKLYGGTFSGCVRGIWQREGARGFLRFLPQDVFLRMGAGTILVTYDMLTATGGGGAGRGGRQQ